MNIQLDHSVTFVYSELAQEVIAIGRKNHWRFRVIGYGEAPTETVYQSGWSLTTLPEAPRIAQDRLFALKAAGVGVKALIIAHELPNFVVGPEPKSDFNFEPILSGLTKIAKGVGIVALATTATVAIAAAAAIVAPILLIFTAVLVDPAIIIICEDGTWVEILNYYE